MRGGCAVARRLGVILLVMALFVLAYFSGNYAIAAAIEPMRKEGLIIGSERDWRFYAGLLKTLPGYIGVAVSFLWGVLADKAGRPRVLLLLGALMGVSMMLVSAATSYLFLLAAFTAFGIGYVGVSPVIYAFVSDVTPSERRGLGYAAYYVPTVLGFIVGVVVAGVLLYWRTAYLAFGVLTLVFAALLYALSRGTRPGGQEAGAVLAEYRLREALSSLLRSRTVTIMVLQILPWAIPWGFITFFAVDYLVSRWGISKAAASLVLAVAALSIAVGHVLGGLLADRRVRRGDALGRFRVSVLGIAVGYVAMAAMLAYPYPYGDASAGALLGPTLLAAAGLMFTTFAYPNINSVISDCVPPHHRGTVFAVYNILNAVGWATGPALYGALVARLAASTPLRTAMLYAALLVESMWLISLAAWLITARYYPEERLAPAQGALGQP